MAFLHELISPERLKRTPLSFKPQIYANLVAVSGSAPESLGYEPSVGASPPHRNNKKCSSWARWNAVS